MATRPVNKSFLIDPLNRNNAIVCDSITKMETQIWRRYKETDTRRKLVDKRLKRGIGIKEETKNEKLYEKYRVKRKELKNVIEELKQRMLAKNAIVKRH